MSEREAPLITVLITARNRPGELRQTLWELRRQTYQPLELLVVDDASKQSLEPVVRECWPEARFVRNTQNVGYIVNRSLGMKMAKGQYVCVLDDDSCFVQPDAIERAMARMEAEKQAGILTFFVIHGKTPPGPFEAPSQERYVASYIGCAHMLRREVIADLGGYRNFYFYYAEEAEYSLRALEAGWRILFYPGVAVHHRVSPAGRNLGRVRGYSFRNNLFTILLNMPARRATAEVARKLMLQGIETLRLLELRWTVWALGSLLSHLGEVRRMRTPVSRRTVRLYDALRFTSVTSAEAFVDPPAVTVRDLVTFFNASWWNRPRQRGAWGLRSGGVGTSPTCSFEHEFEGRKEP